MQPLDVYMPSAGIDKVQFGNLYSHAQIKVLTSVAAKKAFQDSGMTVNPNPKKVLAWLPGYVAASCRSEAPQLAAQEEVDVPQTEVAFSVMLKDYKNLTDPRESCIIKWALLQAFLKAQAEVNIWRAQGEQNQLVSSRSGQPVEVGDQMVLLRETMITREEAEQMLREKAPAISHRQKQDQQRKERTAAVSSSAVAHNNNDNNNEDSLTASSAGSTTPHNIFWDLLFVAYLIPIHQSQFGTSWPKKSLAAIKLQYYHHRKFHTQNLVASTEASVVQKLR